MKMLVLIIALTISSFAMSQEKISLNEQNTVHINDSIHPGSVSDAIRKLAELEGNGEPTIYLLLDTPGGSVFDGLNLIHYLQGYKKPVKTITVFAASMGFQIAEGNPGERLILNTGVLMSHPMSGGFRGELGAGYQVDNRHGFIKEVIETMDNQVVSRSNGKFTLEQYKKAYDNELWTTGKNAVDLGYADSVVSIGCSDTMTNGTTEFSDRQFVGPLMDSLFSVEVKYETSNCPMVSSVIRYQINLVNVVTQEKLTIAGYGYDIEKPSIELMKMLLSKNSQADKVNETVNNQLNNNLRYKTLMFYLKRDRNLIKDLNWL